MNIWAENSPSWTWYLYPSDLFTSDGWRPSTAVAYKRLAGLIATKYGQPHSTDLRLIRCKIGFSLIQPVTNTCLHGPRWSLDFGPMVPHVSTTTGWNWYMRSRCAYFLVLSSSACAAAPPGSVAALRQCDWQKVSTLVASHTRYFSCSQGTMVILSGCFPSAHVTQKALAKRGFLELWGYSSQCCG